MRPADAFADSPGPATPEPAAARDGDGGIAVAADAFSATLRATVATGATDARPLRDALRTFVAALRARGEPPERALIAVKDRVFEAVRRRQATPGADTGALVRRIVHWAIEAYYRAD
jgi:hypothetical protein